MNIETLRHFLLWCTIINYAFLVLWVVLYLQGRGWMHRLYGRIFHLSAEQFDAINFAGIVLYKLGIVLLNMVPLISLYLVS
jgi:hypothetical protein